VLGSPLVLKSAYRPSALLSRHNISITASKGKKAFPSKLVLKVKRHSGGAVERHKARLVLHRNLQRPHIEFYDTYAPVANFAVVRTMIDIACDQKWLIHQLDVKCAFIDGRIDEDVYMRMPDGYGPAGGLVCKLKRSIYGLRQAPRAWHKRLTQDLRFAGYNPLVNAESVLCSIVHGVVVYLIIYVDDILVLTESMKVMLSVKKQLSKMYTVKDLGETEYFLGVKIERESSTVKLTQTSYVKSVLDRFGMLECKPAQTPTSDPVSLMIKQPRSEAEVSQMKDVPFREAIGSVLCLAVRTRPDIAVAVSILSKDVLEPRPAHWKGVKRIHRYLKGTMTQGLQYEAVPGEQNSLSIHCDADWGTDPEDRRSRTGVVCRFGGNVES
jgi:hypothetical protein